MATATCASNISVIKYWGKRDEKLLLQINSSLSVTLDPAQVHTPTALAAMHDFEFWCVFLLILWSCCTRAARIRRQAVRT